MKHPPSVLRKLEPHRDQHKVPFCSQEMDVIEAEELGGDLVMDFDEESLVEIDDGDDDEGDDDDDDDDNVGPARNIAVLTDEEREYIIDMIFNRGVPVSQLSEEIGCTKEAVYGVTRAFRAHNRQRILSGVKTSSTTATISKSTSAKDVGSSSPTNKATKKVTNPVMNKMYNQQEEEVLLKKFIRTNNCTSVKELQDYINGKSDTFPGIRSLSKRTLYRILKRCRSDCTTQNVAADARVLQERAKYVHEMSRLEKLNASKIIYVDVCGYDLTVGASTADDEPNSRGGEISFCVAVSERGILHASFKLRPFTTDNFLGFLRELAKKLPKGRHVFVLDSAPANKVSALQNYFKGSGNVVKYLPKCSPFLNPLVEAFEVIKTRACLNATKRPRNAIAALAAARHSVTVEVARSWIINTKAHYESCVNSETIVQRVKAD